MSSLGKIARTIIVEGAKSVAVGAGVVVILGVATGQVKTLKDISLEELLK